MRRSACTLPLVLLAALAACDTHAPARDTPASDGQPPAEQPKTAAAPAQHTAPPPSPPPRVEMTSAGRPSPQPLPTGPAILPLARVLPIATARVPGEVIEVELDDDDDDDVPEYELKILTPEGRSMEMKIDARSGAIIEVEED